ncbi:MAG TPA: DUF427 domain-containing protein [Ktedonobacterales bacterium]|jgi:uncharacterized protein (DUF427 family)|nr:DUF427 domain-containing protein [Ktedonobacterales bacterium]
MARPQRIEPQLGQESVWDYPRPPRLEDSTKHIRVVCNGITIADTKRAKRILETSHPPVYYIPPEDVRMDLLTSTRRTTFCEWKGAASYYTLTVDGKMVEQAAWYYPQPNARYAAVKDYIAFYPSKMGASYVDDERVTPQPGDFYGGWITSEIVGPFKGNSDTMGW